MHQQIRIRVRNESQGDKPGDGLLEDVLKALKPLNLTVAGFSPTESDMFVVSVDHDDFGAAKEALAGFDATPVTLEDRDWRQLDHVKGALLEALTRMGALDAKEVLIGCTGNREYFVQVRR